MESNVNMDFLKGFDRYNIQARIYPALLLLLPLLLTVYSVFPQLITSDSVKTLASILVSFGVLYFLSSVCRSAGKKKEVELITAWGGYPTTIILRHRDDFLNNLLKSRYHSFLNQNVPGINFPSSSQESNNPQLADEIYISSIDWLKEQRRDKDKYHLLYEENIQYGFRRNLLGIKTWGLLSCIASIIFIFGNQIYQVLINTTKFQSTSNLLQLIIENLTSFQLGVIFFDMFVFCIWLFMIREPWVKEAGFDYAKTLLKSIDNS